MSFLKCADRAAHDRVLSQQRQYWNKEMGPFAVG